MTNINAYTSLPDVYDNHLYGDIEIKNYVVVECEFVFVNKNYDQLELMTSFSAGITYEFNESSYSRNYCWANDKLVITSESNNSYTLNKMIARPECAPKYLRELLPDITDMFDVRT